MAPKRNPPRSGRGKGKGKGKSNYANASTGRGAQRPTRAAAARAAAGKLPVSCLISFVTLSHQSNAPCAAAIGQMPRDQVEESMEEIEQDSDAEVEMSGPDAETRLFNQAWAIATVFVTINAGAKHVEPEMVSDINDLFISVNSPSESLPCSLSLVVSCELDL